MSQTTRSNGKVESLAEILPRVLADIEQANWLHTGTLNHTEKPLDIQASV